MPQMPLSCKASDKYFLGRGALSLISTWPVFLNSILLGMNDLYQHDMGATCLLQWTVDAMKKKKPVRENLCVDNWAESMESDLGLDAGT
jgi:hypothetical protein